MCAGCKDAQPSHPSPPLVPVKGGSLVSEKKQASIHGLDQSSRYGHRSRQGGTEKANGQPTTELSVTGQTDRHGLLGSFENVDFVDAAAPDLRSGPNYPWALRQLFVQCLPMLMLRHLQQRLAANSQPWVGYRPQQARA